LTDTIRYSYFGKQRQSWYSNNISTRHTTVLQLPKTHNINSPNNDTGRKYIWPVNTLKGSKVRGGVLASWWLAAVVKNGGFQKPVSQILSVGTPEKPYSGCAHA